MKKTLIAATMAATMATAAFADVGFGAWIRGIAVPAAGNGDSTVTNKVNSWGWGCRTVRLDVHMNAEDGKAGLEGKVFMDAEGDIATGDDAFFWVKPVDQVKLSLGKFDNPTPLRGDFCYGSWNWIRPRNWLADDEGFLMSGSGINGMRAEIVPNENLLVFAAIPYGNNTKELADTYKGSQVGFAYNIEGVGKLKAQFLGAATPEVKDAVAAGWYDGNGAAVAYDAETAAKGDITYKEGVSKADGYFDKTIEAEFDLTSVENLFVGAGFAMNMWDKADDRGIKGGQKMKIALAASYKCNEQLKLSLSGAYFTFEKGKDDGGIDPRFQGGLGVDYDLGEGLGLSADVRYLSKANDIDKSDALSFLVGLNKGVSSNGSIGIGFQGTTNGNGLLPGAGASAIDAKDDKGEAFVWAIPVSMSVWF